MNARERYPTLYRVLTSLEAWSSELTPQRALRSYQLEPGTAILDRIARRTGHQLAVVFCRQSGKDEMLAQLISLVLMQHAAVGGQVVVAAPTLQPQAMISLQRLRTCLLANPLTAPITRCSGNAISVGAARAVFVSAAPTANARGLTADLLLVANEAQHIDADHWDAVFDPMAASTNAVTVFMGTVWSDRGLLARQMRFLEKTSEVTGQRHVWRVPWTTVADAVPAYGERVRSRIQQLGERHPFIQTEYFLKELDGSGGLFPPERRARMQGNHPARSAAQPGKRYALLLDVGGEEEHPAPADSLIGGRSSRDSTALTVVEVDTSERPDGLAVYRVVHRQVWTGVPHTTVHQQVVGLATTVWRASWVVVDATGIGAGLASFLKATFARASGPAGRVEVVQFVFTASSKSRLGWDFLGLIDAGRFREYAVPDPMDAVTTEYQAQLCATDFEVVPGPGNLLRWSVPAREGHDDLVISAALCAVLETRDHRPRIAVGSGSLQVRGAVLATDKS